MGDTVILKGWVQAKVPCFYNPLTTSLQPHNQSCQVMKTMAELRRHHNLPIPVNKDSLYKVIPNVTLVFLTAHMIIHPDIYLKIIVFDIVHFFVM